MLYFNQFLFLFFFTEDKPENHLNDGKCDSVSADQSSLVCLSFLDNKVDEQTSLILLCLILAHVPYSVPCTTEVPVDLISKPGVMV